MDIRIPGRCARLMATANQNSWLTFLLDLNERSRRMLVDAVKELELDADRRG